MTDTLLRSFYTARTSSFVPFTNVPFIFSGSDLLLVGETDGMASDFTRTDGTGYVSVKDVTTPANNLSNVIGDLFWTNAGTSPKLVNTSTGTLQWSPHNMFLNSAAPATQNVTLITGAEYTVTVTGAGGGNITGSSGASGVATTGSPATFTATGTTGTFTYSATLTTIQLNRGPVATAYLATAGAQKFGLAIDYDGTNYGLLTEPAATNVTLQSQAFDVDGSGSPWANSHTTVTANATTAPDGTTTADKVIPGTGLDTKALLQSQAVTIGVNTVSFYAKPAGYNFVAFRESSTFGSYATFDISNGTVIESGTGGTGAITSVGNGWYRVSMTYTSGGTPETMAYFVMDNSYVSGGPAGYTYTGDGSSGVYFWQAQTEVGTVATSAIPSFAATVTRAKDNISQLLTAIPFSTTVGTVYAKYLPIVGAGLDSPWVILNDTSNFIEIYDNQVIFFIDDAASAQVNLNATGSISYGSSGQSSAAWKANDFAISLNGAAVNTDVSGTVPTGLATFALGREETAAASNMRIYKVVYVPRRVIDGDLPTWRYV